MIIILYHIGKTFDQQLKGNFNSSSIWTVWQQTTDNRHTKRVTHVFDLWFECRSHELNIKKSIHPNFQRIADGSPTVAMDGHTICKRRHKIKKHFSMC